MEAKQRSQVAGLGFTEGERSFMAAGHGSQIARQDFEAAAWDFAAGEDAILFFPLASHDEHSAMGWSRMRVAVSFPVSSLNAQRNRRSYRDNGGVNFGSFGSSTLSGCVSPNSD